MSRNQPRDSHGRWTSGGGSAGGRRSHGRALAAGNRAGKYRASAADYRRLAAFKKRHGFK